MNHQNRLLALFAFGFVFLGMAVAVPGVTWPSVAESFGRSLADLGYVTLLFGGGYTVSSYASGRLSSERGIGTVLVAAGIIATLAFLGIAASGSWPMFLVATGLLGLGGGLVDAATNTYVAIRRGARAMGSIHGVFGIGAIAGPLLVTALLQGGASWRVAYALLALGQSLYVVGLWSFARRVDVRSEMDPTKPRRGQLRTPIVFWSLAVFFVYAGIGAGAGVWAFSYLTDERGISDAMGGLIVGAYWGGLTTSRLVLGALGDRFQPDALLRWSVVSTALGFVVLWLSSTSWLAAAALIFAGFAHGPFFPLEVLLTPRRVGEALTSRVVGFEIAAANVGGALVPSLIGLAVGLGGLSVIPPILVVNALALIAVVEMLRIQSTNAESAAKGGSSHPDLP